jgi:uncharacterized membrane-anchored protein YjiN (DUF445 family)
MTAPRRDPSNDPQLLDAERAHDLRRMKTVATGLLVVVALIFVAARAFGDGRGVSGFVEAFAEAAMVGALADWFAVTALFRHPLGLPIPHTAIIPKRKDQIGASLGEFVQENFLTRELLDERLQRARVGARLGDWLSHPANAVRASAAAGDVLRGALDVIDDAAISGSIEGLVERRIRATPAAPLVGRAVDLAIENGHHQRLLDSTITGLANFLDDNRDTFRGRLEDESPWWVPETIDDRIFDKIYSGVHRFLSDIGADPTHEVRASIDRRMVAFAQRLRTDPEMIRKGEELKDELLAHPDVRAWIGSLWGEVKRSLEQASVDPDSELRRRVTFSLGQLGMRLRDDPELQAKVDSWVVSAGGYLVENYRGEVSRMIESTVARWDGESTSRRMELQVGRDLQFIRINGTVVGGLAGVVIHLATVLS